MHIDSSTYTTPDGKTYTRHLLRESYRRGGKVLKRTLANLSHLEPEQLEALRLALAHKGPVCELATVSVEVELRQGASVAAVVTVLETARRLSIEVFRGNTQDPATVAAQIAKLSQRFGGGDVTLVGDRGMLRSREVANLTTAGMH